MYPMNSKFGTVYFYCLLKKILYVVQIAVKSCLSYRMKLYNVMYKYLKKREETLIMIKSIINEI